MLKVHESKTMCPHYPKQMVQNPDCCQKLLYMTHTLSHWVSIHTLVAFCTLMMQHWGWVSDWNDHSTPRVTAVLSPESIRLGLVTFCFWPSSPYLDLMAKTNSIIFTSRPVGGCKERCNASMSVLSQQQWWTALRHCKYCSWCYKPSCTWTRSLFDAFLQLLVA